MKQSVFVTLNLIISLAIGVFIWTRLPQYLQEGGPLVALLLSLLVMLIAFIIERLLSLNRAKGKGSPQSFFKKIVMLVQSNDLNGALAACDKQRGSLANVLRAGLEHYSSIKDSELNTDARLEETQRAIEEANALEVPLLERNLIALSTIASIATMVGLLGTTIGMIRAFHATGQASGGVIDATSLATGISEALVNTAGGLTAAIIGIVAYNFFVNKVDSFNYTIDEASYEVLQLIKNKEGKKS